jgi:hypothetical protein
MENQIYSSNRAAKIINEAGRKLQAQHGDLPLETNDIDQEVMRLGSYHYHSVPPSDYCYNLINKAPSSVRFPLFEWIERGKYKYLGPGHNFTGPILWKGKQVGEWKSGIFALWEDPRE